MKSNTKRKICVITGTRADYGILYPVMRAIQTSPTLELHVVATGMHLDPAFGHTVDEIAADGFSITAQFPSKYLDDTGAAMGQFVGQAMIEFTSAFQIIRPDIIVTLGDRGEMLAAATAGNYLRIPVAHIHGGEISGHVDGIVRHAITKLAHLHFPATADAEQRILKLGEESWRVTHVGAPALDRILRETLPDKTSLYRQHHLDPQKPLLIVVFHPVSNETADAAYQMRMVLEAVSEQKLPVLVLYPNSDAGGRQMIEVVESYRNRQSFIITPSIPQLDYLGFLKYANVLIGNSSSGIIEAPSFKLPVINIGSRQQNRERANNVLDVEPNPQAINQALTIALDETSSFRERCTHCHNPYGDGKASQRIVAVLETIELDQKLLQKQLTY